MSFDAVIIGAGFSGIYMLKTLRDQLGLKVRVIDAASSVGGTWYWNRYPGARCDTDAFMYCYTFDKELLQEWEWSERYPAQPEILRYLEHVAAKHDLERDMQFDTKVTSAEYDEKNNVWNVRTDKGETITTRYLIGAVGALSERNVPPYKGLERFKGKWYHTSRFPKEGVDFTGKRVAVVGTGSSGVQSIPEIVQQAKHLTVFQRTAAYCVPARNGKVDPELVKQRKANYDKIVTKLRTSVFGFDYDMIMRNTLDDSPEQRERELQAKWDGGGFDMWVGNYQDMFFDAKANDAISEFLKKKIRATVRNPATAEKLIPKGYYFGTKRMPIDTNYFETFNRDNVLLVDAATDGPIEEITENGIRAAGKEYAFDIIVFATGFDALTAPLKSLNITGREGRKLERVWAEGPRSYLGLMVNGFPNFFTLTGPQSPSVLANMPVAIEQHVEFLTGLLDHMKKSGKNVIEPTLSAQDDWVAHVNKIVGGTLMANANSWYASANIADKPKTFLPYLDPEGIGGYRKRCDEIAAKGYEGFSLS